MSRGAPALLAATLASALLSGCPHLQKDLVALEHLSDCPKMTVEELAAGQDQFGPTSDTATLECALALLRVTDDLALRKSTLGSRVCLHLAERATQQTLQEKFAAEGVRFAETAIALGADGDGALHYYLAENLGLAVREHVTLAIGNLGRLEQELQRALQLSPDVDQGGPLRMLGMLYLKAPPWPKGIGDGDKAIEMMEQAVRKHPGHPLNHLFYAQALWEVLEEEGQDQARLHLIEGLKLLEQGNWGTNKALWKKEAAELEKDLAPD